MNTHLNDNENLDITKTVITKTLQLLDTISNSDFNISLIKLLQEIDREIVMLISNKDQLTLTSLHVRNIFELHLIIKHIFLNKKAFNSWMGQIHKDTVDIIDGFNSLLLNKNKKESTRLIAAREQTDEIIQDSQYSSKGPFNIKSLAETYGFIDDYFAIYKLCSKLVHPSSLKVNTYSAFDANKNYHSILIYVAIYFCQQIEQTCHDIQNSIQA